ncbi:MAG: ParB/RepB/Spo0J family partition protein [Pseudomonadota bacterium]
MAKQSERKGLGRGLSALMAETVTEPAATAQSNGTTADQQIAIEKLYPNPDQPRREFAESDISDLAASISQSGIIQPLIVRPDPKVSGAFQIVAGERRWRAAQRAQLHEVPIVVRSFSDEETLEVAIIENVQRVDLNPVDEAFGYRQLMERFGHTQEQVASALGKSRSHIANVVRLLGLPDAVLDHLKAGRLSAGHARALVTAHDPVTLAEKVVKDGLSVRQTEALAKAVFKKTIKKQGSKPQKDADTRAIEGDLSAVLGMRVQIDHLAGQEGGTLKITYKSFEDLDRVMQALSGT